MTIHEQRHDRVLELVIENPPVNAFTIGDLAGLAGRLRRVEAEPDVHAVVVRSRGRGFCGGGDLKEVQGLPGFEGILGQAAGSEAASVAVVECAVPVVAAVHGYCIGVGCLIAGCADIVVASHGTSFVFAEIDNGATAGIVQSLGLLPQKRLLGAMLTCEPVSAEEMQRYGSIHRLVDEESLAGAALAAARTIAGKAPAVVRRFKRAFNTTTGRDGLRALYRQELSHTYELNLSGEAAGHRQGFLDGERDGYLDDSRSP